MKKIVYKSKAIQAVILIIAGCLLLSLWPFRLWKETVTTSIPGETGEAIGPIDDNRTLMQSFVAQYDHMGSFAIYLCEDTTGESFYFRLFDESNQLLFEEEVPINRYQIPGYHQIPADVELTVGKMYHIVLQGNDSVLFAGCEFIPMTDMPYAGTMYYMEGSMEGKNIVADYHYTVPLRKGKILLFGAVILAIGSLLSILVSIYYKKTDKDSLITVERVIKAIGNPVIVMAAILNIAAVCMQIYGSYLLDNVFLMIATLLLAAILLYALNHDRTGQMPILNGEILGRKWPDYLQSVCLAAAFAACCEYMNGLYDIHHTIAERKQIIWFGLAVLFMLTKKEAVRLYNLLYLAAAAGYGCYYYNHNLQPDMDELHLEALKLTVWAGAVAGLVILNVVISLVRRIRNRQMSRPQWLYLTVLILFFVLFIIFRNERMWPVVLVVSFGIFYLQFGAWKKKEVLLGNIVRALVFHFIWATGYAWLHRPFVTFRTARYTHIFHTVTITATYLTMVECVAAVLFLNKFTKSRKLKDFWKEALFLGVVSTYMLFTMARTGFFAVGVMMLFALVMMCGEKGISKIKQMGMAAAIMVAATVITLPVIFMIQRNVPAIVSEPYLYDIESYPDEVLRGRKIDSVEFMRVGRLIDVFAEKIFGIPEGTFDIYGEIAAYNEEYGIVAQVGQKDAGEQNISMFDGRQLPVQESELIASLVYHAPGTGERDSQDIDYTNGRIDIYRSYLEQLNLTGHIEMGALLQDGSIATHAHNIYLQVAYDHGIIVGIVFILFGAVTFLYTLFYYRREKGRNSYAALPAIVVVTVAVAGFVEWIFHFSNPSGFMLMLVIAPLIWRPERNEQSHER